MNIRNNKAYNLTRRIYHYIQKGKPQGYIFMLHRVDNKDPRRLHANENMKVSPYFLDGFLKKYQKIYDYIHLRDIPARLQNNFPKPFMAFALDDGYKDNFTKAVPIFTKYNVPFTVFVATDFPDREAVLWWYTLEDYLLSHDNIAMSDGRVFSLNSMKDKEMAFMEIRNDILKLDQTRLLRTLPQLFTAKIPWGEIKSDMIMSWDDVREIGKNSLATIGCHTKHHYNLRQLPSADDVITEVMVGKKILQEKAQIDADVFAYPFGSPNEVGEREIEILSKLPFKLAFLAYGGWIGTRKSVDMYALPRIMLTDDFSERQLY